MEANTKLIYDDRGVPLCIGIPSLIVVVFAFWIAISVFFQYYLHCEFKYQMRGEAPSPMLAIVACLGLGCWMAGVFFYATDITLILRRGSCLSGMSAFLVNLLKRCNFIVQRNYNLDPARSGPGRFTISVSDSRRTRVMSLHAPIPPPMSKSAPSLQPRTCRWLRDVT